MNREQQKAYNAENYPASVLTWLNEATDRAFDEFENRTCGNCKFYSRIGSCENFESYCYDELVCNDFGCNLWEKKDV